MKILPIAIGLAAAGLAAYGIVVLVTLRREYGPLFGGSLVKANVLPPKFGASVNPPTTPLEVLDAQLANAPRRATYANGVQSDGPPGGVSYRIASYEKPDWPTRDKEAPVNRDAPVWIVRWSNDPGNSGRSTIVTQEFGNGWVHPEFGKVIRWD